MAIENGSGWARGLVELVRLHVCILQAWSERKKKKEGLRNRRKGREIKKRVDLLDYFEGYSCYFVKNQTNSGKKGAH